jgi:DNA-binding protein H-NS
MEFELMSLDQKAVSEMSMEELVTLQEQIKERMDALREAAVTQAVGEIEAVAERAGMSLLELLERVNSGQRKGPRKKAIAVKYRNPATVDETWTGRGRKPKWIERELAVGKKLEDFAV